MPPESRQEKPPAPWHRSGRVLPSADVVEALAPMPGIPCPPRVDADPGHTDQAQ